MTASQGFLHAAMMLHGDLGRAVRDLNRFVHPRRPETKFLTLWVGIFDPGKMTVSYVDAGHGYAVLEKSSEEFELLREGDALSDGFAPRGQHLFPVIGVKRAGPSLAGGAL